MSADAGSLHTICRVLFWVFRFDQILVIALYFALHFDQIPSCTQYRRNLFYFQASNGFQPFFNTDQLSWRPSVITFDDVPGLWGLLYVLPGGRVREIRPSGRFPDINRAAEISLLTACLYIQKPLKINTVQGRKIQLSPTFGEGVKETEGL